MKEQPVTESNTFLHEVAEAIVQRQTELENITVVFPNRRAVIYFRKHLASLLVKPSFAPRLVAIEDFIQGFTSVTIPEKLELIFLLYQSYSSVLPSTDAFDQFYFWGEMLLRDFEEMDKYLIPPDRLFKDLRHQKELDEHFDYLTAQQKEFLQDFWSKFTLHNSLGKEKFLEMWAALPRIYHTFQDALRQKKWAYEGMLHKEVVELLTEMDPASFDQREIVFAGFNALTAAEEQIVKNCLQKGNASVYWDLDEYYFNADWQEAGKFLREYQNDPVLGRTFPHDIPAHYRKKKNLNVFGASQPVGQVKLMAQIVQEQFEKGILPEDTVIVLPDERLLFPTLHSISGYVDSMNVTMGFPLSGAPLFGLIEAVVEMQINARNDLFNHRQVLAILGHPYGMAAGAAEAHSIRKKILDKNWVHVDGSFLREGPALFQVIFQEVSLPELTGYLQRMVTSIGKLDLSDLDREFAFYFITLLNRIDHVFPRTTVEAEKGGRARTFRSYLRLFRQLVRSQKIPFTGEPLKGLQIMGVLETRNLDFKNVFILSLNEGVFPAFGGKTSYLPFNIRRAYGLPTVDHQDSTYAYLFYRLLQRAQNVYLFYNAETDVLGQGEMSRYLRQVLYESHPDAPHKILHNIVRPLPADSINIVKDQLVFDQLARYCEGHPGDGWLSPTALNSYVECRLKFYYRYVAGIKEPNEVEEELDARVMGNFLHETMELFYTELLERKKHRTIEADDLADCQSTVQRIIDHVVRKTYNLPPDREVVYEGQRLVIREIIMSFADRILAMDRDYAPFSMEGLEDKNLRLRIPLQSAGRPVVVLGGALDRVDLKEGVVRVIDYKTGKDKPDVKGGVVSLFRESKTRNKAAFQTFLYALLYASNHQTRHYKIKPGLINRMNLFDDDFRFGLVMDNTEVEDVRPYLEEFREHLKSLLEEIFNPEVPFSQTEVRETCGYCPYKSICYR